MPLIRWNPLFELNNLQGRMNRLFDEALRTEDGQSTTLWSPAADVLETESAMIVKVELPGMDRNDINIHLENNVLTVRGERPFEKEGKAENYHRVERAYGSFSRSFALPVVVDQEKISADYKDGILRITLPKKEQARAKKIEIAVAS